MPPDVSWWKYFAGRADALRALHEFTGRLPLVLREGRRLPLGSDTDTAMREGVLKGMEYEISGYITAMKHKYPELLVF